MVLLDLSCALICFMMFKMTTKVIQLGFGLSPENEKTVKILVQDKALDFRNTFDPLCLWVRFLIYALEMKKVKKTKL